MQIGLLILGWAGYFFLHSVFASEKIKAIVANFSGSYFKHYRLVYVVLSVGGLLALLFLNAAIPSEFYFESDGVMRYVSLVLTAFGVIIIRAAFKEFDFASFIGTAHQPLESFSEQGILAKVRHPIYVGTILLVMGFFLFSPNLPTLASVICVFLYLPVGIYLEERKLIKVYGDAYLEYKRKVPAIIPRLFK